jgi:hypothetical protein
LAKIGATLTIKTDYRGRTSTLKVTLPGALGKSLTISI